MPGTAALAAGLHALTLGRYPVPAAWHRVEQVVTRSRFITTLAHASDAPAAHEVVETIRAEFPDATHHCWAFVAGPPGDTASIGMSDDGEPHGTAGRPMLHVLLHGDVGEIVAVVTRWFGGVKLGRGGLARAYSSGVVSALETLPVAEKVDRVQLRVSTGYETVEALKRLMVEHGAVVEAEEYGSDVTFRAGVPGDGRAAFEAAVAEATHGRATVEGTGVGDEVDADEGEP